MIGEVWVLGEKVSALKKRTGEMHLSYMAFITAFSLEILLINRSATRGMPAQPCAVRHRGEVKRPFEVALTLPKGRVNFLALGLPGWK